MGGARKVDPTGFLVGAGFEVKREGRHLSVRAHGDEVYRVTRKPDGVWLWCDVYGNSGGDNIALVRELEPSAGFIDAVFRLNGGVLLAPAPAPAAQAQEVERPALPPVGGEKAGQAYLAGRGVSRETIKKAEASGMVRYVDGGVLFVGYDQDGRARNVTKRATDAKAEIQKRDLKHSDKRFPPVLRGNPASVWIVEVGVDALAVHDLAKRKKQEPPTVIVSGGANVRGFFENPTVQAMLRGAERVTIVGEREKSPETQAKTDAAHDRQAARVLEITGREARRWTPSEKDVAEQNYREALPQRKQQRGELGMG